MNYSAKTERFILTVVKWLELNFLQSGLFHYAERLIKKFFRIYRSRGRKEAIKFAKNLRTSLFQWLNTTRSLDKSLRSKHSVALPKDLRFLKHIQKLGSPGLRLILSSLYVSRGLELPPEPNIESITGASTYRVPPDMSSHIRDFWYTLGYRHEYGVPRSVYWKKFHMSTKNGPNGQALWSAVADLSVLPDKLVESICIIGGKRLRLRIELLRRFLPNFLPFFSVAGKRYRKISAISDQEGKTREIAILDYWSQTALRGLHQFLFRALRKIPQDCTFDQGSFKDKISKFPKEGLYYSVDLTTATDRFPIDLIGLVLEGRFSKHYVNSWRDVMVGYQFDSSQGKINYSVGNPMGAYSSWNSFALAHHFVVYYCCRKLGIDWQDAPYVLLGDDIVIKHDALAKLYMNVMTQLGVKFSLQKSHISPHMFEFAKRTFYNGEEITPFPIAALNTTRRTPSLMLNVLVNEEAKGWISSQGTPANLSELYRLLGFNATYVAKKRKIFYEAYQVMIGLRGGQTAGETVMSILACYYPKVLTFIPKFPTDIGDNLSRFFFMKMLRTSLLNSTQPRPNSKPLGLIAERLVIMITGQDELAMDAFDLIQALPVLQIHGQVEETYLKVVKGGDEQMQLALSSDWKSVLRALTIPISDQVYISRNQELLVHASFTLAKILDGILSDIKGPKDLFSAMKGGLKRPF